MAWPGERPAVVLQGPNAEGAETEGVKGYNNRESVMEHGSERGGRAFEPGCSSERILAEGDFRGRGRGVSGWLAGGFAGPR